MTPPLFAPISAAQGQKKDQRILRPSYRMQPRGLSTKIHTLVDTLGNPIGFHLTLGQAHDLDGADFCSMTHRYPPAEGIRCETKGH